jgi:hypothetical protein
VTTAVDIVEALLEAPLLEATATMPAPAPDNSPLRVFGDDAPDKGWLYRGPDPLGEFIKYKRGPQAVLNRTGDRQAYINYFTRQGYTLVFKKGAGLEIWSRGPLHIPQDGINALEQTMGLTVASKVNWNGDLKSASAIIYGQPERATKGQPGQPEDDTLSEPDTKIKAMFGGGYGEDGDFSSGHNVNVPLMRRLLGEGHAFVIKYPSGSFNVIIPERYQFKPGAIRAMEQKMGLTRKSIVQWFIGAIKPSEAIHTTAAEAIYGERA